MWTNDPVWLGGLFAAAVALIAATRGLAAWRAVVAWSLLPALAVVVINPFVASYGTQVLWRGPVLPVVGRVAVTVEEVAFGLTMGLKMLVLMSLLCLYDRLQRTDQALQVWGRVAPKTALTLIMATLVLPRLQRDIREIREALMARGASWTHGAWPHRIRQAYPVFRILLLSSLEGSWQTAEALYARAFGSGRRTSAALVRWGRLDTVVAVVTMTLLLLTAGWWLAWRS